MSDQSRGHQSWLLYGEDCLVFCLEICQECLVFFLGRWDNKLVRVEYVFYSFVIVLRR
jgi:hypothetical protein